MYMRYVIYDAKNVLRRIEDPKKNQSDAEWKMLKKIVLDTYDVDYLHEREAEAQHKGFGLVAHRSLQHIVRVQQIVQQPLLV